MIKNHFLLCSLDDIFFNTPFGYQSIDLHLTKSHSTTLRDLQFDDPARLQSTRNVSQVDNIIIALHTQ